LFWRPEQHADAIKGNTVLCERQHSARNFNAFAPLARRREYQHLIIIYRFSWIGALLEEATLKPRQRTNTGFLGSRTRNWRVVDILDLESKRVSNSSEGSFICRWRNDEKLRYSKTDSADKVEFSLASYGHVQQNGRQAYEAMGETVAGQGVGCGSQQAGPVGEAALGQI
jgi:hypothetical protein